MVWTHCFFQHGEHGAAITAPKLTLAGQRVWTGMAVPMEPKQPITPRPNTTSLSHTRSSVLSKKTQQLKSLNVTAHMPGPILDYRHTMQLIMCPPQSLQFMPTAGWTLLPDRLTFLLFIFGAGWKFIQSAGSKNHWFTISLKWSHGPSDKIYICMVDWENPRSEMLMFLLLNSDFMLMLFSSRMFNSQDVISQELIAPIYCHGGGFPPVSETNLTLNLPTCLLHTKNFWSVSNKRTLAKPCMCLQWLV